MFNKKSSKNSESLSSLRKEISKEFPGDTALQEVHVARKILLQKAKAANMTYLDYIKSLPKKN
jgi:hypothetical protein